MANPVPQYSYICVYDRTAGQVEGENGKEFDPTVFNTNGLAILKPSKCVITENLNGSYSVTLTHPTDKDNLWKTIYVMNFLKVQGQLFRIQSIDTNFDGSSSGSVTAYAEHIMYLQNDAWIFKKNFDFHKNTVSGRNVEELLISIWRNSVPDGIGQTPKEDAIENFFPRFYFSSDVEIPESVYDPDAGIYVADIGEGKTRYEMIMDAINRFGGELYRNNFYYSIKNRMENAIDNAFDIRVGGNLLGIKRNVDTSKFCTYFRGYYEFETCEALRAHSYSSLAGLMNASVRAKKYTYEDNHSVDYTFQDNLLLKDVDSYFSKNMNPHFTYTIKMKDVRRNPEFQLLSGTRFKVGDTGRIKDTRLGVDKTLKVIQTKTNGITGEVEEITLDSSYDFDWHYSGANLPKFPKMPKKHYDELYVSVIRLDENMQETDDVRPFGGLTPTVALSGAASFLHNHQDNLYHVHIGNNVVVPGTTHLNEVFTQIDNLYSIDIPEGYTELWSLEFNGCSALTIVNLPDSITKIGKFPSYDGQPRGAFSNTNIKSIKLPKNLKEIGGYAFYGTPLESITFPDSLEKIGLGAFGFCQISEITIPDNTTVLAHGAFTHCYNLSSVHLGEGLTDLGSQSNGTLGLSDSGIFDHCTSLTSIQIPASVTVIGRGAFVGSGLETISFDGEGLQTIEPNAFQGLTALALPQLPQTITSIGASAFFGCSFTKFDFPPLVTEISANVFYGCSMLSKVTFPENLSKIGRGAFNGCAFKQIAIPEGVTEIGYSCFANCTLLQEISLPDTLRKIGMPETTGMTSGKVFSNCTALSSIAIPANVREIAWYNTFSGCTNLINLSAANSIGSISGDPWGAPNFISTAYAKQLAEQGRTIPADKHLVTWSGSGGINDLDEKILLKELNADGTLKRYDTVEGTGYIKSFLQENPDTLFGIDIGQLCTGSEIAWDYATITADAFSGLTNLKYLSIPSTFNTIEANAFSGCTELDYLEIVKPKSAVSGEPWGAPAGTVIYYAAELITENGDTLTARDFLTVRTTGNNSEFNTGLSGILRPDAVPEEPVEKTLYILNENHAFSLKLGTKELRL